MTDKDNQTGLEMKYFVLKPRGATPYARASRLAMLLYADEIESENAELAEGLRSWVTKEQDRMP